MASVIKQLTSVVDTLMDAMQLDPEFTATVGLIRRGEFGYEDFFSDVLDSITHGSDYYLLANDFQSYIKAQVMLICPLLCAHDMVLLLACAASRCRNVHPVLAASGD